MDMLRRLGELGRNAVPLAAENDRRRPPKVRLEMRPRIPGGHRGKEAQPVRPDEVQPIPARHPTDDGNVKQRAH